MALTRAEKMEAAATIYDMVLSGESDDSIMAALGMSADTFHEAKRFMMDLRAAEVRGKTPAQVYVEYVMEQRANQRTLDTFIGKLDEKKQYNALVGAIRLRADLTDRVLQCGFDLGVIKKTPERHELVGGLAIANMSDTDLRKSIQEMVVSTTAMVARVGAEADILSVDPGALHVGEGYIAPAEDDEVALPTSIPVERKKPAMPLAPARHAAPAYKSFASAKPAAKPTSVRITPKK